MLTCEVSVKAISYKLQSEQGAKHRKRKGGREHWS